MIFSKIKQLLFWWPTWNVNSLGNIKQGWVLGEKRGGVRMVGGGFDQTYCHSKFWLVLGFKLGFNDKVKDVV